jgi:threonine/homoserine/homoserine lactone efflux protein
MTAVYGHVAAGLFLALIAVRLWRHGGTATQPLRVVTPAEVFVTTLLNPKAFIFAMAIIPFDAPRLWPYLLGFVLLVVCSAIGWIVVGAWFEKLLSKPGWAGAVPRIGAVVIGAFSLRLLATPLIT